MSTSELRLGRSIGAIIILYYITILLFTINGSASRDAESILIGWCDK